jgi:hypothetical protein
MPLGSRLLEEILKLALNGTGEKAADKVSLESEEDSYRHEY